jgi:hypothetical protein
VKTRQNGRLRGDCAGPMVRALMPAARASSIQHALPLDRLEDTFADAGGRSVAEATQQPLSPSGRLLYGRPLLAFSALTSALSAPRPKKDSMSSSERRRALETRTRTSFPSAHNA